MKRFTISKPVCVMMVALSVFGCLATSAYSQLPIAMKKQNESEPKEPKTNPPPPKPPEPGAYSGFVNGKINMVLRETGMPMPGAKGGTSYKVVGKTIDLKAVLAQMWNDSRSAQEAEVKNMLKAPIAGHRLYDAKVTLASASAQNKLHMSLSPKNKQVVLRYTIPNNKITCQADVAFWFDPTVRMTFDLELVMVLQTNGTASDPVVLKSASLVVRNAKVNVDGDRNASAERTLNSKSVDVRSKMQPAIAALNNITLRPYTNQGYRVITPRHTLPGVAGGADLLLEMSRPPLAATSK